MPPKFQSSFIPKGPLATAVPAGAPIRRSRDLYSFVVSLIFGISVALALGAFLYKFYLNYSIAKMSRELEAARETLNPELVNELLSLSNRISSTEKLIEKHRVLSPLFAFLEASTPKSVRFTELSFNAKPGEVRSESGYHLILRGQATSYSALAFAAKLIQDNPDFESPVFSDIELDERGNVSFMLETLVDQEFLSYEKMVEKAALPAAPVVEPAPNPVATSTPSAATTTPRRN